MVAATGTVTVEVAEKTEQFEAARPQLLGIAYRLLGSLADAEDAVQDTCVKWLAQQGAPPRNAGGWLVRVCTNRCLDILRSGARSRTDYVGPWLPEQLQTETAANAEEAVEIASSLTTAFLLLLQRLTPKERAAYLLHDIFAKPFPEVAEILGMQPAACRQLAARARGVVAQAKVRHVPSQARQEALLHSFFAAVRSGETEALAKLLSEEVELTADSGGKVAAPREVLRGSEAVCRFVAEVPAVVWPSFAAQALTVNGQPGLLLTQEGQAVAVLSLEADAAGRVRHIFVLRNPEKIARLQGTLGLAGAEGALRLQERR